MLLSAVGAAALAPGTVPAADIAAVVRRSTPSKAPSLAPTSHCCTVVQQVPTLPQEMQYVPLGLNRTFSTGPSCPVRLNANVLGSELLGGGAGPCIRQYKDWFVRC
eukprot:GHRQ01023447.1.p1 GENE.GHRQ01023447.1~~GHRQ01023447.1.p1  ORF type:complete len:106 (+),score=8.52 GHRQ01023447.1:642-959(+)